MGIGAEEWKKANVHGFYFSHLDESIQKTVSKIAKLPHEAHPGTKFTYGYNFDILGALIEIVSGKSLDKFLKKKYLIHLKWLTLHFIYLSQN